MLIRDEDYSAEIEGVGTGNTIVSRLLPEGMDKDLIHILQRAHDASASKYDKTILSRA